VSPVYVALGDSMSIDDYAGGAGRGAASLLYRNRDTDFPGRSGRDLATAGFTAHNLARDGATAAGVLQDQLPLINQPPDLVTLTMGGNDLLAVYGSNTAARAAIGQVTTIGEQILARLNEAGCGQIVVSTVYDPSDGTGELAGAGLVPPWPEGPALVQELNAALAGLASRHSAVVADVHSRFLGHGAAAGDPSQGRARPASQDLWYCNMIEPNAWGAHQIRCTWWQALNGSAANHRHHTSAPP